LYLDSFTAIPSLSASDLLRYAIGERFGGTGAGLG